MTPYKLAVFLLLLSSGVAAATERETSGCQDDARKIVCDLQRIANPDGIQESLKVQIGGVPQWIYVRSQDKKNPVLLFVHGGPASPMTPSGWQFQRPLEEYFTVVNWDQRGAGRTYLETDPKVVAPTLTKARFVDDVLELAETLRTRYGKQKVIVLGHSWGSLIALEAVKKRPDLFYAYVGAGQVINGMESERLSFDYGLKRAREENNVEAIREMESIAPYPGNLPLTRERVIIARKWPQHYGGLTAYRDKSYYYFNAGTLSPEYSDKDIDTISKGSMLTLERVIDDLHDARLDKIKRLDVPVFMLLGRHDYTTPSEPVAKWLATLDAPMKKAVWFDHSAHMMLWEEPGKLLLTLTQEVRPLAMPK